MEALLLISNLIKLYEAGRLLEAEALERALIAELSKSTKPENCVAVSLMREPQESAHAKVEALNRATQYLESAYEIRKMRTQSREKAVRRA